MKYFIAIMVLIIGMSTAYAQYSYTIPTISQQATVKVIWPFLIQNVSTSGNYSLPHIVNGTKRTLSPLTDGGLYIFKVSKEQGYDINFTISGNTTDAKHLSITGLWYWTHTNPGLGGDFTTDGTPIIGSSWVWGPTSNSEGNDLPYMVDGLLTCYALMAVSQIDASDPNCTNGQHTFTLNISGSYTNL